MTPQLSLKGKTEVLENTFQLVPRQNISLNGTSNMRMSGEPVRGKTPDISAHFTKKNVTDKPLAITHSVDLKTDKDQEENVSVSAASVTAAAGPTRSMNSWGDVEHLFEGYDDKQRVLSKRENSKILDHTLLNSAKFHEVETAHEAMLRKKEEQDRDKPYRHLFRFPHMGMWTKLRTGIWNFLEKASKLYELHL
ncbi:RNA polymerase II C-terminal domain phosphatase-like 3 [Raphanus sativus]|nr:RNA polymerase II C-terminal domain phosphatase-like 3 [Raphanus sativus]